MGKQDVIFKNANDVAEYYNKDQENNQVVLFQGVVYHVGEYMSEHPGGEHYLKDNLGTDIQEKYEDAEHTKSALKVMHALPIVGHVEGSDSASTQDDDIRLYGSVDKQDKKFADIRGNEIKSKITFNYDNALMWQVFNATWTFEEYVQYINEPKHLVNPLRDVILFDNVILEQITQSPWWGVPLFNFPLILFAILYPQCEFSLLYKIGLFLTGMITWTWVEYALHRYFFHGEEYWMNKLPHVKYVWYFHFLIHGVHHAFPQDRYRIVFPPIPGFFVLLIFGYLPTSLFCSKEGHPIFYAGFLLGYVMYDMMHFFMHKSSPTEGSWWQMMKIYHMQHHYKWGMVGFGVSSKFWDIVYDTTISKSNKDKAKAN